MRKLMIESLNVESFQTAAVPRSTGTVQAHAAPTQNPCYTHEPTCGPTDALDCTLHLHADPVVRPRFLLTSAANRAGTHT